MSHINYDVDGGVATITIDRQEKRNAMDFAMLGDFRTAVRRAADDTEVRSVIVTGTGGAFCAGTDLAKLHDTPQGGRRPVETRGEEHEEHEDEDEDADEKQEDEARARERWPIARCPKPVIAAIDGPAMGLGVELATLCDVRIASSRARLGWVFVHRGLVPDMGVATFLLPRLVGAGEALRLILSGEAIDAEEALRIGFVRQVVEPADLLPAAREEAARYLAGSPFAVSRAKRLLYDAMLAELPPHFERHDRALRECLGSEDHAEGVRSFLERRPATFLGR